jgi:hypothetical protein
LLLQELNCLGLNQGTGYRLGIRIVDRSKAAGRGSRGALALTWSKGRRIVVINAVDILHQAAAPTAQRLRKENRSEI